MRLAEANIPIAALEREAHAAVTPVMRLHLEGLWEHYLEAYPGIRDSDSWFADRYQLYDDFRAWLIRSPEAKMIFVKVMMNQPGSALAKIARRAVRNCQVHISVREYSDDPHRNYGGYFNYLPNVNSYVIVCFVDEYRVLAAAEQALHDIVFGETLDESMEQLSNIVVPIFVHEFVHLQQELRDPRRPMQALQPDRDHGITTVGGGKKGNRRSPEKGHIAWARYTGSMKEIESFASQTASEMISDIQLYRGRTQPDNSQIDRLLVDLAGGWGSGRAFTAMNHMRTYWEDFEKVGVKAQERDRVWKRYLKLTYQKIWQFRTERLGKTDAYTEHSIKSAPKQWREWAKSGMAHCANMIARDVAFQTAYEVTMFNTPEKISKWDQLAQDAVMFVQRYFFKEQYDYEEALKVSVALQRLIEKAIERQVRDNEA